jgi:uncharacterized membrane protein
VTDGVHAPGRRPRGWMSLYAAAFVTMLAAGALLALAARELLSEDGLLWASIGLSGLSLGLAVLSLVAPRRR